MEELEDGDCLDSGGLILKCSLGVWGFGLGAQYVGSAYELTKEAPYKKILEDPKKNHSYNLVVY